MERCWFRILVPSYQLRMEWCTTNSTSRSVTLDTADVSFDRFDLIVLSEDGTVSVIKGIASDNPIIPTLPNDRLLLLTINVKVGMTEPNVISEIIYNENSEWTTSILIKEPPKYSK